MMTQDQLSTTSNATTWTGALGAGIGAVTVTQWLAIGGFAIAVIGLILNQVHNAKMRAMRREELELKKELARREME